MHLLLLLLSTFASAQDAKPWKLSAELGYVKTGGNTDTTSLSNKDLFQYHRDKLGVDLEGAALRSRTSGVTTAENYGLGEKVSWSLTPRTYVFERVFWDRNRFSGIDGRTDASLGLGRDLLTGVDDWYVEAGLGKVWEQRVAPAPDRDYTAGRVYTKYKRAFTETTSFSQDAAYLPNLDDGSDYRLSAETAVTATLSKNLSFKTSYLYKRQNLPPPGVKKDDTQLGVTLIATY